MKTKEELNTLKEEVENLNKKLTAEELEQVSGGAQATTCPQGMTGMGLACKNCLKKSPAEGYTFTCDLGLPGFYSEIPKRHTN